MRVRHTAFVKPNSFSLMRPHMKLGDFFGAIHEVRSSCGAPADAFVYFAEDGITVEWSTESTPEASYGNPPDA